MELSDAFLANIAGWEAMKQARFFLSQDRVLSADWSPPLLQGIVQDGSTSYRAGLVVKSATDIENICSCRPARQWGTICAHSVAVGLQHLKGLRSLPGAAGSPLEEGQPVTAAESGGSAGQRWQRGGSSTGGEPAELFVILPPNLAPALARGKVMVCLEGRWRGGRSPLNALPRSQPLCFSEHDARLLERVEAVAGGQIPALLLLETKDFVGFLELLIAHPRVTLGKSTLVDVVNEPCTIPLKATLAANGEIELRLQEDRAGVPSAEASAGGTGGPLLVGGEWVFQNNTFQPLGLPSSLRDIFRGPVRISRSQVPRFLNQDWPGLAANAGVEANFRVQDFALEPQAPRLLLELKGGLAQLSARLQCQYGARILTPGVAADEASIWLPDPDQPTRYSTRDVGAEQAALGRLRRAGFTGPDDLGRCQLLGQDKVLNFFAREFPRWQRESEVTLEERLERSTAQHLERLEPRCQITPSGVQWFDLDVAFRTESGERFSAADIQRLLLSGQSHARLKNGKIAVIDTDAVEELQEVLLDCSPRQHEGGYRISGAQAGFLDATLRLQGGWQVQAPADWRERARQQSGAMTLECPPLGELENVLRPYQKAGVVWLHFLRQNNFGGILADEMGLGKTLQTLALLHSLKAARAVREQQAEPREASSLKGTGSGSPAPADQDGGVTLVVCPTSLVYNWVAEARKFTPALKVLALHGPERHALFDQIPRHDLVVTSYALIRRDAERYRELEFDTVVLDEAQHIKNRQTQNAQAVKAVRARHRLVLTGTPLENSVFDLWSIFDFLMPGYLGAAADFRERYEQPIMRDKNGPAQTRLARRLRPFVLRRLKREVAPDLPAKIEQVSFCELTGEQRTLYQQVIEASRQEVLAAVGAQGLAKSRMVVLKALLRLRQICCDLRLLNLQNPGAAGVPASRGAPAGSESSIGGPDASASASSSGKLELFGELLAEVLDGGHRVLVFSQFVSMLTLLREKLTAEGIEFCYLDGATINRGEVVERFQRGQSPVFLISLKAGGVGLNLTGADTVIHFDPWWNPAVEDQATDRAHRLGQARVVTSYKLIARGTVEEKILALQARKREIIQGALGGEEQLAEALTWEEIQELLA